MSSAEPAETSGPSLGLVLGGIAVLATVLGVVAYWRYTVSEKVFAEALAKMDEVGGAVDTEGCVTETLKWHETCAANKPLCDDGVARIMTHCLVGRDRKDFCETLDLSSAKAQWVWNKCVERGTPCKRRKKCACANAYRAIDSFCRYGQEGVSL